MFKTYLKDKSDSEQLINKKERQNNYGTINRQSTDDKKCIHCRNYEQYMQNKLNIDRQL